MSAVLGIIMSHGGALQLFSQQGQGTTFKVYLPGKIDEIPQNTTYLLSEHPHQWTGCGTILLVEDEDQVRNIARTLLELFGFSVLEAVHGKQALELYHKNASNISLVMTDIGMPVMDGYELFNELKQLNPELPIIVSSGYGEAEVSTRIAGDQLTAIMSKPYRADQLRDILKKIV
jgi:CheY-like chemotaxis protein